MSSFKFANKNKNISGTQSKINNKYKSLSETFIEIASGITGVFVFIIFTIFPLYTHDMYFDILGARYVFFKVWGIMLSVLLFILGVLYLIIDARNVASSPSAISRFISSFHPKNIKKHIILTDIFFVAMLIVCIISTLGSSFKEEAFFGNAGRYQGLECWIIYFITYFAISRTYKFKIAHLDFAIIAGCISCIWGVLDFLWLDPFGFFKNVNDIQKSMFASSIGNLNTFTNYTIMIFALAATLFIKEKKLWKTIFYFIASIIGCAGCVFGLADNAVLGLFAFYLFIPFFTLKCRRDLVRYLFTIDFLLITLFFFHLGMKAPIWNWGQGSFFRDVLAHQIVAYLFIPYTVLLAIFTFIMYKMKPKYNQNDIGVLNPLDSILPKQIKIAYIIVVIIGFTLVTYILLDVNVFKKHLEVWNQLPSSHQLYFNDNWGTHRGHNWRIAFTNFTQNFSPFQKLFGYGPDTYLVVSERTFYEEMVSKYGEVYDSAHNEYINYLICEGALGLLSYLGIFICGIFTAYKTVKKNVFILAPIVAVICYMIQAVVNIAIPITTPIFFTLMYIGVAHYFDIKRNEGKLNQI